MADYPGTMVATDVHQHLWPEGFVAALARRADAPAVRRDGRGWLIRVPGEPDSPFGPATHDPLVRAADLRATGLERALLCMSTPLGIEALAEDEARPLLGAWHDGVFAAGDVFGVWGALPVHGALPEDVDVLLARGAVGVSLPATALASPGAIETAGPVLTRLASRGAPLLVHPGPVGPAAAAREDAGAAWWPALTTYVSDMHRAWHAYIGWGTQAHPTLRVCFAMLAGLAPLHAERLALRGGPSEAINNPNIFYDTSSYGRRAIGAMADAVGLDQLVTGSDRPVVDPPLQAPLGERAAAVMATTNVHRLLHREKRMIRRPHTDRDLSRAELELAAVDLLHRPEEWQQHVFHDPSGARTYHQLAVDDHLEAWLICWSDGNDTGFHDHDQSHGAVGVAAGHVREETLALGGDPVVREVGPGAVFSFDATDIHRVLHIGDEAAVTLHLYSPPLRRMGAYEVLADGRLARRSISAEQELAPATS